MIEETFVTHIGVDESGKGDFFGPLVIAGVMVDEKSAKIFEELRIRDSKKITDGRILKLEPIIKENAPYSVIAISNGKYNELYGNMKNLNKLLAWGHARTIENILEKNECGYAISDKFGNDHFIQDALMKKGQQIKLDQMGRGESDIAVAAASILARAAFVHKIKEMQEAYGIEFPKGCAPQVKECAREFIAKYGKERLKEVCKTHFKTYNEV